MKSLTKPAVVVLSETMRRGRGSTFSAVELACRNLQTDSVLLEVQASNLSAKTQREIDSVRTAVTNHSRPRVLCVVDRIPGTIRDLYAATRGSYLDELISIAGGESIAPVAEHGYGKINKEAVLTLDPEAAATKLNAGTKANEHD